MSMTTPTPELLAEIAAADAALANAAPSEILRWVFERFGSDVAMACSFEDLALLHMIHQQQPDTEIVFLDTEAHFPETLAFRDEIAALWSLNVTVTAPGLDAADTPCGATGCCQVRKVGPLQRAVEQRAAWITAVKRVDAATRATMPIVQWDDKFGLVKVNPLATWTDEDIAYYLTSNELPEHPLWAQGYASIGCAPVTVKPLNPGDRRSGRWAGADKVECGLHEA
jgi:phosphoadenosine phosphosulfate reductase